MDLGEVEEVGEYLEKVYILWGVNDYETLQTLLNSSGLFGFVECIISWQTLKK